MARRPVQDLVVVVPGIMGSALGLDGRPLWALSGSALRSGLRTGGRSLNRLQLPKDIGDENPGDGVEPLGLMPGIHGAPCLGPLSAGYESLLQHLESSYTLSRPDPSDPEHVPNLIPFAYDWRLSNRLTAACLAETVEAAHDRWIAHTRRTDARVVLIAHSMGGLICRYYLHALENEKSRGAQERVRALVTLGTPYRGSINALLTLVNSKSRVYGKAGVHIENVVRSLPSLHQLLPIYACIESPKELLRIDDASLDGPDPALLADGVRFHQEIERGVSRATWTSGALVPVLGIHQTTFLTSRIEKSSLIGVRTIEGDEDDRGDGTVPALSAYPPELRRQPKLLREHPAQHGHFPDNEAARNHIHTILRGDKRAYRGPEDAFSLDLVLKPEYPAGQPVRLALSAPADRDELAVSVVFTSSNEIETTYSAVNLGTGRYELVVLLEPDVYTVTVAARGALAITAYTVVWSFDD